MRDLDLPPGPNPGRELIQAVAGALASGDTSKFNDLRAQVVQRQHDICVSGGAPCAELLL